MGKCAPGGEQSCGDGLSPSLVRDAQNHVVGYQLAVLPAAQTHKSTSSSELELQLNLAVYASTVGQYMDLNDSKDVYKV